MAEKCPYGCKGRKIMLEAVGVLQDCPHCTGLFKVEERKVSILEGEVLDVLEVPQHYRNMKPVYAQPLMFPLSTEEDRRPVRGSTDSKRLVVKHLEDLANQISHGEMSKESSYIYIPHEVEIERLVYSMQFNAIARNMKVTPYVSLNVLNGILKAPDYNVQSLQGLDLTNPKHNYNPNMIDAVDGWNFIRRTKLTYSSFVNADLCFLRATSNTTDRGWSALADILEERARHGRPTTVFGYWQSSSKDVGALRYLINREGVSLLRLLNTYEVTTRIEKTEGPTGASLQNFGEEPVSDKPALRVFGNR